jgi:hypothetical protein
MRKLLNRKIRHQGGICAICHEELTDYNEAVPDIKIRKEWAEHGGTKLWTLSSNDDRLTGHSVAERVEILTQSASHREIASSLPFPSRPKGRSPRRLSWRNIPDCTQIGRAGGVSVKACIRQLTVGRDLVRETCVPQQAQTVRRLFWLNKPVPD